MKCESVNPRLADYAQGRCGPITRARIRRHLSGCPDCTEMLREDEQLDELLETWSDEQPTPSVWLRIREAIDQTPAYVPDTPVVPWWVNLRMALIRSVLPYTLGAVTAALLVMVGLDRTMPAPEPTVRPPDAIPVARQPEIDKSAPDRNLGSSRLRPEDVPLVFERRGDAVLVIRKEEDVRRNFESYRRGMLEPEDTDSDLHGQPASLVGETH